MTAAEFKRGSVKLLD